VRFFYSIDYTQEEWYTLLPEQGKHIADLIIKQLYIYKKKDNKFRNFVCIFRILIFFFAMCNTIILGIKFNIENNIKITVGLILSAILTFLTTMVSYFNFEQYWMINRIIYFELCTIKDNFIYEAKSKQINDDRMKHYLELLDEIQDKNIKYWKHSILRLK